MAFYGNICETCPIRTICSDEATQLVVMQAISYRDRAVITEAEFAEILSNEQIAAVSACEDAQYNLKTCDFSDD